MELGIFVHFDLSAIAVLGSLELSCSQGKLGFRRPAFRLLCLQTEWMSFLTECRENRGLLAETGRDVTLLCGSLVVRQLVDDAGALGLIHGINLPRSKGLSGVRAQHCFSSPWLKWWRIGWMTYERIVLLQWFLHFSRAGIRKKW